MLGEKKRHQLEGDLALCMGLQRDLDCLGMHILDPLFKLWSNFKAQKMDLKDLLDLFVSVAKVATLSNLLLIYIINLVLLIDF